MRNTSSSLIFASFVFALAGAAGVFFGTGCADGGGGNGGSGGTDGGPACFDYSAFDGTKPMVSFKDDVLPIFQRSCGISMACHGDPNTVDPKRPYLGPKMGMVATAMDITIIRGGIIDVPSAQSNFNVITTGKPDQSFMMYKLDFELQCDKLDCAAMKACGTNMPQGASDPLAQDERDTIRRWIAQGAVDN